MTASLAVRLLTAPIRFYQRFVSPALPPSCRYVPTCSSYAVQALQDHGALRGTWLSIRRLGRCHPWHEGGLDPVPPVRERRSGAGSSSSVDSAAEPCPIGRDNMADSAEITPDARLARAQAPRTRSNAA